jgi:hypothetical protein
MVTAFTPYTTAVPLFGPKPGWLSNPLDIQRIQAYQVYEELYWNAPDTFVALLRGTNNLAIYVPTAKTIIDTIDRYTGAQFQVNLSDVTTGATNTPDVIAAQLALRDLFARERFLSKFDGNKLYGIMRGDWIWHVTADPTKPQGTRISITAMDPAMYFPIPDEDDVDDVIGCHLAAQITTADGARIHRLTYRKVLDGNGNPTGQISVEEGIFALTEWESPNGKPEKVIQQPTILPTTITSLPVYHVPNTDQPGDPFGSSELRGLERVMAGINQTISDEDLALALDGIGMYATDAPQPTNPTTGEVVGWQLGPGRVVKVPEGAFFNRVSGISSTAAYGEHYDRLFSAVKMSAGTPDVAIGSILEASDVSGISLALQLSPVVSKSEKKNTIIKDVHTQMFFDLVNGWYPAYEVTTFNDVRVECGTGSAVPVDRAERFSELTQMLADKVIDAQYYRDEATKLGYVFPADIQARVDKEASTAAANQAAAFGTAALTANAGGAGGNAG